jgi:hypothetical protein
MEDKQSAIVICEKVRPLLYDQVYGNHFPFAYDDHENKLTIQKCLEPDADKIADIYLSLGRIIDSDNRKLSTIPSVIHRLNKETSQGRVFVINVEADGADVKVNPLFKVF